VTRIGICWGDQEADRDLGADRVQEIVRVLREPSEEVIELTQLKIEALSR